MAKQKSGLGRGLNALFDESAQSVRPAVEKQPKTEETTTHTAENPSSPVNPASVSSSSVVPQGASSGSHISSPVVKSTTSSEKKTASSDIYISEDALEHAKVVSREARKSSTNTEPKSAPVVAQKSAAPSSAPSVSQKVAQARSDHNTRVSQSTVTTPAQPVVSQAAPQSSSASPQVSKPSLSKGDTGTVLLDKVQPNPDQPRTNFKQEEITELANSIKKEGLLQPILVRKVGDHYQIIAGERRWQACKTLNMKEIPVRFWKADNDKALELALIENVQRSDLNPIEEAYGYKRLMERKGMTQSEVAQTVSKGRSTIANALRLLDLPEEAQQLLFEEKISAGHARAILSIPTAEGRKTLTKKLMNEKLSVRETESLARLLAGRAQAEEQGSVKRAVTPASFKKAARGLTRFFSAPVRVKTVQGKNKIEIQFKDEEDLERILTLIASDSSGQESAQ